MDFFGKHSLVVHPNTPPTCDLRVTADVQRTPNEQFLTIQFAVRPAQSVSLPGYGSERRDGLWQSTCFELFVKAEGDAAYREFNFAPMSAWNAYEFQDWREGMAAVQLPGEPYMVDSRTDDRSSNYPDHYQLDVILGADSWPAGPAKFSLTAVIEEKNGNKSYWALAHPQGDEPNFHHPHCFTVHLA